ncbi:MAG: L,D-transpeptidase family protein [Solirubrobacterales bacterium]|nr:L,D-transpeptidase family protein [Solirubrobacterales bacterium]
MRVRSLLLLPALAAVVASPALAATPAPPERITAGVTAGGIDVGGLTVLQAARKVKDTATPGLMATPFVLGVAGKPYTLSAQRARLKVNGTKTAEAALERGKAGEVPLVTQHSDAAVRSFVRGIARKVYRAPRSATLKITLRKMKVRRSKLGRRLDQPSAARVVTEALEDPTASRTLHKRLSKAYPRVNTNRLKAANRTILTVSKRERKVRLFKGLKFNRSYGVAIGQPAYPTPEGLFSIQSKQVNPVWSVPNSPWAGELQGTTVAGGSAANPLKARWMGIVGGIGFHGTGDDGSIGTAASHGCLRMHVSDVIALYKRVSIGTPVLIR